jgi:CRP/FNR family transcriptional regulator
MASLQQLLSSLNTDLIKEIQETIVPITVAADTQLLEEGSFVHAVPLVIKGLIRVSRRDEDKELLLYYIHPGELCIMSFSACCNNSASAIIASTVENTELLLIPSATIRKWLAEYPSFNSYVYGLYHHRYADLIDTINQLIFYRLDERLMNYLLELSKEKKNTEVSITHQMIANDLGTAREVVSRLMKKLEKEGKIEQGRNLVRITANGI